MPDSTAPAPIPVRIAPPPAGYRAQISAGRVGQTGLATASLVLGIVALFFNILLLPTILAIVFGAIALGKATAARRRAIAGIVLGGLGIVAIFLQAAIAIPVYLALQQQAKAMPIDQAIARDAHARGEDLLGIQCPPTTKAVGETVVCTAESDSQGRPATIRVTFTTSAGEFNYRVEPRATPAG